MLTDHPWVAFKAGAVNDPALRVDDTQRRLFDRDVEVDVMLRLGHDGALLPNRAAIMRRHRSATRPEYPTSVQKVQVDERHHPPNQPAEL
jgi:hypothetical protein